MLNQIGSQLIRCAYRPIFCQWCGRCIADCPVCEAFRRPEGEADWTVCFTLNLGRMKPTSV